MEFEDIFENTDSDLFGIKIAEGEEPHVYSTNSEKKKKKTNKKEDYSRSIQKCPSSPFKCKTHTAEKLRLKCFDNNNPPNCRSCGIKLEGTTGYLSCPKSANCFFICSACRVCPANHILRNVINLKVLNQENHPDNSYKCSSCEKTKNLNDTDQGVMHCGACDFSVCISCME